MTNAQYFTLRRLHSLLGVFPLGAFLIEHLLTNASGILGAEFFEHKVALFGLLGPLLPVVEALFIFIPLALHIGLGIYIALQSRNEIRGAREYARNWAYIFQRLTGWIALVFILYHVITLRFLHNPLEEPFSTELGTMFYEMPGALWFVPFYILGTISVVFHFANGLCTFCMTWGITKGKQSQRYVGLGAAAVGGGLLLLLFTAIGAFWIEGRNLSQMDTQTRAAYVQKLLAIHHPDAAETPQPEAVLPHK